MKSELRPMVAQAKPMAGITNTCHVGEEKRDLTYLLAANSK